MKQLHKKKTTTKFEPKKYGIKVFEILGHLPTFTVSSNIPKQVFWINTLKLEPAHLTIDDCQKGPD